MFTHLPTGAELISAIPVILSLIMIEGLLSVDNAMAIAALASHLPKRQQTHALRYGIVGAYLFRGLMLATASFVGSNPWIKVLGAAYLLYLMASNLTNGEEEGDANHGPTGRGLLMTIIAVEIMDLSLSIDNVVAAVALDKRLWVVCTGVFIGILALRFVAGFCIRLIEKFPILQKTAFFLIGFVGAILLVELGGYLTGNPIDISAGMKFAGILTITALTLVYDNTKLGRKLLQPVVDHGYPVMKGLNAILSLVLKPVFWIFAGTKWIVVSFWRLLRPAKKLTAVPPTGQAA